MKISTRIFFIFLLFLLTHCSIVPKTSNLNSQDFEEIQLERTGCFGSCPIYKVTIQKDGTVIYDGKGEVQIEGERRVKVSKENIDFLLTAFDKVKFLSLKDSYETKQDGCKDVWTDHAKEIISFRTSRQNKTVTHYDGCIGIPDADKVSWLAYTVDILINTRQWIGYD